MVLPSQGSKSSEGGDHEKARPGQRGVVGRGLQKGGGAWAKDLRLRGVSARLAGRGFLTCFIIECRATVGKLNFRSIMHRIWQFLAGMTHSVPLAPGSWKSTPAPTPA